MGLFDKLFKMSEEKMLPPLENISDEDIVAMASGELVDVKTVSDAVFAEEMMGKSAAFRYEKDSVIICSPANGTLAALFPTGHAFGVKMNNGVQVLVHIGVDTVKAGDPIVEADIKKLSQKYDMSVILIITDPNGKEFSFIEPQHVSRGQTLLE